MRRDALVPMGREPPSSSCIGFTTALSVTSTEVYAYTDPIKRSLIRYTGWTISMAFIAFTTLAGGGVVGGDDAGRLRTEVRLVLSFSS